MTLYPLAIADLSGKLYQPTAKHLFRNELIKGSCDSTEKNTPKNAVHVYDGVVIVRTVASQKNLARSLEITFKTLHTKYGTRPLEGTYCFRQLYLNELYELKLNE